MQRGAKGVKITVGGRLGGSEMSRRATDMEGRVPLHTLRADIDYGMAEAHTTFGRIGVKAWIYKGDILPEPKAPPEPAEAEIEKPVPVGAAPSAPHEGPGAEAEGAAPAEQAAPADSQAAEQ
jgi:small subunit ribosomal protein S3